MDMKKIGGFLKLLRKERGLTQEQAGEIFMVAGRTISRWENGVNMPDLSLLIQIAEYYDVELEEILNGERRNEDMDKKLKNTLLKAADYSELEKKTESKGRECGVYGDVFYLCYRDPATDSLNFRYKNCYGRNCSSYCWGNRIYFTAPI